MTGLIDPRGKLLAHLPRLAMLQQGERPAPINCELDLSNRCSLGCEWCHFAFTHTRGPLAGKRAKPDGAIPGGDLIDTALALSLIDELAEMGTSLTITGGGEPTLHPDFDEIVAYAADRGVPLGLYTHGGHLNADRAELLKQSATFVYVSLDAANADDYKRDKGVDRFAAACEGVRLLAKPEGNATVGVGYLVTAQNYKRALDATRLARDLGADYVQFRPTVLYEQDAPDVPAEDTDWLGQAVTYLRWLQEREGGFVIADLDRFRGYQRWQGHGYPVCWWSALQTVVTPNGKVWTCVNKREHPAALIGDLTAASFSEIWAARPLAEVDGSCRTMCRGHISNLALTEIMAPKPHSAFV